MAGIIEFYKGKHVFITGATGFIGKPLIEKLLRSCPDIGNIYILIRPKKGKDPSTRLKELLNVPLFDLIRRDNPEYFRKIIPILGDCSELDLGLSPSDRQLLVNNVSAVFHCAANVRFDDPLKSAIFLNTRGTREVMLLANDMTNIKVLVHLSTTYCNCDRYEVDEILYPPPADWRNMISITENTDEHTLDILTPKLMRNFPNTYTFTKSLAEHVVKDLGENIPTVIFRPSIVVSTADEPFPGWIDNFNGPVGLTAAVGKGILRTLYARPDCELDFVPVDLCIKAILISSWIKAISGDTTGPTVYNASNNKLVSMTIQNLLDLGLKLTAETPLNGILWHPHASPTNYMVIYYLKVIFLQLIPAIVIDKVLKFYGQKPMLTKLQRKIYSANMALSFFTNNDWIFVNKRVQGLRLEVLPCDKKEFDLDRMYTIDPDEFFRNGIFGARLYLLKESEETLPQAKKHFKRMLWLSRGVHVVKFIILSWLILHYGMYILK